MRKKLEPITPVIKPNPKQHIAWQALTNPKYDHIFEILYGGAAGGKLLEIMVIDHIADTHFSFAEEGLL